MKKIVYILSLAIALSVVGCGTPKWSAVDAQEGNFTIEKGFEYRVNVETHLTYESAPDGINALSQSAGSSVNKKVTVERKALAE